MSDVFPILFNSLEDLTNYRYWLANQIGPQEWQFADIDNPRITAELRLPEFRTLYGEKDISYKLNRHNFRCPEFDDLDITKPIFAVGGCSMTFGTGLPIEDTWSYIIYERLKKEFPSTQYVNLAMGGTSLDFSTRILSAFGDKKRYFDCYVNLQPEISRREFSMNGQIIIPFMHIINDERFHDPDVNYALKMYAHTMGIDEANNRYNFNKNVLLLDLMSSYFDFPMLLDSWALVDKTGLSVKDVAEQPFKKYFVCSDSTFFDRPVGSSNLVNGVQEHLYKGRDGIHPGRFHHQRYADGIYDIVRTRFLKSVQLKRKNVL
jgi:hypothetical protein